VTDADLLLGRLDPNKFAGGSIVLSRDLSTTAILNDVAKKLDVDANSAAFGVCEVVDESMANAARMHAVENGKELADYSMIAFGGAAPLHASRLCEKLGIKELLVPPGAGVGSAIGFLRAPVSFESVRGAYLRFSRFDAEKVNAVLRELQDEARRFVRAADPEAKIGMECTAYIRYVGQGWEIPVPVDLKQYKASDGEVLRNAFEGAYAHFFGRSIAGLDAEIISWSLRASTAPQAVRPVGRATTEKDADVIERRKLYDARTGAFLKAAIVERSALAVGDRVAGPAAIVERETTTIVSSAFEAVMQPDGCLLVRSSV
jgi:N-methylhydantoinase A